MENNDIVLNGSLATWNLPLTQGDVLGTYSGTFVFKCYLTPTQQLEAGREFRSLLGANAGLATETESNLAFALGQLKYRIVSAPPFWTSSKTESGFSGDIPDLNIIALILDTAIRAENLFKEKITKEREALLDNSIKKAEDLLQEEGKEE